MRQGRYGYTHPKLHALLFLAEILDDIGTHILLPYAREVLKLASEKATARKLRELGQAQPLFNFEKGKVRLTSSGRELQKKGDLTQAWSEPWNSIWFVTYFDISVRENNQRRKLTRYFGDIKMGHLQGSTWVSPRDPTAMIEQIVARKFDPRELCVTETTKFRFHSNEDIVAGAWKWDLIRKHHQSYLSKVGHLRRSLEETKSIIHLGRLARAENEIYCESLYEDPMLPVALWPKKYLGEKVANEHLSFLRVLSKHPVLK